MKSLSKIIIISALLLVGSGCVPASEAAREKLNNAGITVTEIQTEYGYCLVGYFGVDAKPFGIDCKR